MMILKKTLSIILAATILFAFAVPSFSANDNAWMVSRSQAELFSESASETQTRILAKRKSGIYSEYYGKFVQTSSGRVNYSIFGDAGDTIVLLPGYSTPSPYFAFLRLAEKLSSEYKVVIIEPLGYGLSDTADTPRTADNICGEIHEVLASLGEDSYYLMGHSIAGLYMLDYANLYTDEVLGVIGLDASVPAQGTDEDSSSSSILSKIEYSKLMRFFVKIYYRFYLLYIRSLPDEKLREMASGGSVLGTFADLSNEDKRAYAEIWRMGMLNDSVIDEKNRLIENCESELTMRFPDSVPVLYLLASETVAAEPEWKQWHEELIQNNPNSRLLVLNGGHWIHLCDPEGVVTETGAWINNNNV